MEVRDPVHGTILFSNAETAVVDSPEFQRLRAIKQLGFADVSFPGATHTRFLHSMGVSHLASMVFDHLFKSHQFTNPQVAQRLKTTFKLAALLHDVGHGPLSHTTEEVMPPLSELGVRVYDTNRPLWDKLKNHAQNARATHEDYSIKYLTDSPLTQVLENNFSDIKPLHIACLIDKTLDSKDDFFVDRGIDFRPILSQLVSSELDVDRMDYLERDSYYTGTNYGKIDLHWLIANLIPALHKDKFYLGLNRRALYTFDDFLLSRHHIHLMVYFHHKAIIYEEMLNNYLLSEDCDFALPSKIQVYTQYNDFKLYEHLALQKNEWAQRITQRKPYRRLVEMHSIGGDTSETSGSVRAENYKKILEENKINVIWASSSARLSKYHSGNPEDKQHEIYIVDQMDPEQKTTPLNQTSEIFGKYQDTRVMDRLYVAPENFEKAEKLIWKR